MHLTPVLYSVPSRVDPDTWPTTHDPWHVIRELHLSNSKLWVCSAPTGPQTEPSDPQSGVRLWWCCVNGPCLSAIFGCFSRISAHRWRAADVTVCVFQSSSLRTDVSLCRLFISVTSLPLLSSPLLSLTLFVYWALYQALLWKIRAHVRDEFIQEKLCCSGKHFNHKLVCYRAVSLSPVEYQGSDSQLTLPLPSNLKGFCHENVWATDRRKGGQNSFSKGHFLCVKVKKQGVGLMPIETSYLSSWFFVFSPQGMLMLTTWPSVRTQAGAGVTTHR